MSLEQQGINALYSQLIMKHGKGPEGLGWGVKDRRILRFFILASQWNLEGAKVLDFGCGFGDLYGYLLDCGIKCHYLGIDINLDCLKIAEEKYPLANFLHCDLLEHPPELNFDYVLSSGVFNDKRSDAVAFRRAMLSELDALASKGIAVNFLSAGSEIQYDHCHYNEPADVLRECYQFSNNVILRHDYMPFEFSVFINKHSQVDCKKVIYEEFCHVLERDIP